MDDSKLTEQASTYLRCIKNFKIFNTSTEECTNCEFAKKFKTTGRVK